MSWLSWAEAIKSNVNLKPKRVSIDNVFFKLHYRITFLLLLSFTSLVTLHEYFGDKISCTLSDPTDSRKVLEKVIDTFCFFTSTFTVPKHHNNASDAAHPGVGPVTTSDDVIHHKYYQWVPYCLFIQALTFYIPHLIWRHQEKGRLRSLVGGFDFIKMLDEKTKTESIAHVVKTMKSRLRNYNNWISWLSFCEFLNLINVIGQWALTNRFLDYQFMDLGSTWQDNYYNAEYSHLDAVFPKMSKCTFKKYGPSGSLQVHDALCVLSLNIVNEKIYLVLWFWLIFLSITSILALLHRLFSLLLYRTPLTYNALFLKMQVTRNVPSKDLLAVMENLKYSEWCFFNSLMVNLNGAAAESLLSDLAESFRNEPRARGFAYQVPPNVRRGKDEEDYFNRDTIRVRKPEEEAPLALSTEC